MILQTAAAVYPNAEVGFLVADSPEFPNAQRIDNALYLDEHGLLISGLEKDLSNNFAHAGMKITAAGLDFLEDDGGLSAILGVITIRLHADTIKSLLLDKVEASNISKEEKSKLRKHLDSLSGEAWKEAGKYLAQQGLHHLPDAVGWLYKLISDVP